MFSEFSFFPDYKVRSSVIYSRLKTNLVKLIRIFRIRERFHEPMNGPAISFNAALGGQ